MPFQPGSTNRTALRFVRETVFNTMPATPALKNLRYTGESIAYSKATVVSQEIRDDRATSDLIQVGASVAGDINIELSTESFDQFLESTFCSTFSAPVANLSTMKNGVALHSYAIQKHFQDLAVPIFQNFTGCRIGGMSLSFQTGQILTGSFSVMGCAAASSTAQVTGAVITSPGQGNPPLNAVTDLTLIKKNGVALPAMIKSLSLQMNNNLRAQEAIGTLGYVGIGLGRLEITGDIELYFEDPTEYTTFLTHANFALEFTLRDADLNLLRFVMPRCKYEEGSILSGGLDQDLMVAGKFRAIYDPTSACMIQLDRTTLP